MDTDVVSSWVVLIEILLLSVIVMWMISSWLEGLVEGRCCRGGENFFRGGRALRLFGVCLERDGVRRLISD